MNSTIIKFTKRWYEFFSTERAAFWLFVIFLVIATIIRVGYYPARVMQYDQSVSGPFIAHLLADPHLYANDMIVTMRPFGFIGLAPFTEGMALRELGIDPLITSYLFTIAGNVAFILALLTFARLYMDKIHAAAAALIGYVLGIDGWSLAIMSNLQVYPTATDLASALVIFTFTAVLRGRWFLAAMLLCLTAVLHPVFALFAAIACTLSAFFDISADWKETITRQSRFVIAILIALGVPFTVMASLAINQISYDYFVPLLYGMTGHQSAWLNTVPFFKNLALLLVCVAGYFMFSKRLPKPNVPLFWCMTVLAAIVCAVQWLGITCKVSLTVPIALMAATRCSVYIAYLAFPILYRGVVIGVLGHIKIQRKYIEFAPHVILIVAVIMMLIDCVKTGNLSYDPLFSDEIALSKWMQSTPPETHFLVTERALQQDSFALRPAAFPMPYLITTGYRVRDERAVKFDQDMIKFWGLPNDNGRKWVDQYINDIEQNRMQHMTEEQVISLSKSYSTRYFITRKTASPLTWPIIFKTAIFIVYEIPRD